MIMRCFNLHRGLEPAESKWVEITPVPQAISTIRHHVSPWQDCQCQPLNGQYATVPAENSKCNTKLETLRRPASRGQDDRYLQNADLLSGYFEGLMELMGCKTGA